MFCCKGKQFNIVSFIIKTAIVVLSIVVSLCVLFLTEQYFMAMRGILIHGENVNANNLFRINEKEVERLMSGAMPAVIITRTLALNLLKFVTFIYSFAVASVIVIAIFIEKHLSTSILKIETTKTTVVRDTANALFYSTTPLNTKLTI